MRRTRNDDEGLAIGFISLTDLFFVGLVAFFAYAKSADVFLTKRTEEVKSQEALLTRVAEEVATTREGYRQAVADSKLSLFLLPLSSLPAHPDARNIPPVGILPAESATVIDEFQRNLESMSATIEMQRSAMYRLKAERDRARLHAREHYSEAVSFLQILDWELGRTASAVSASEILANKSRSQQLELEAASQLIERLRIELAVSRNQSIRLRDAARSHYSDSVLMTQKIDSLYDRLSRLESEASSHRGEITRLEESLRQRVMLPKELLGVRGSLKKVAFVVDCSRSMQNVAPIAIDPTQDNAGSWWQVVTGTIHLWIETLPMESAVIIYYSDDVTVFPASREFLNLNTSKSLLGRSILGRGEPKGATNTLLALKTAYELSGCDTIILFTDGEPNRSPDAIPVTSLRERDLSKPEYLREYSKACWDQIFAYVQDQRKRGRVVPVNVVALGNYFDSMYGPSLVRLASSTGGSFLGRGGGNASSQSKE